MFKAFALYISYRFVDNEGLIITQSREGAKRGGVCSFRNVRIIMWVFLLNDKIFLTDATFGFGNASLCDIAPLNLKVSPCGRGDKRWGYDLVIMNYEL